MSEMDKQLPPYFKEYLEQKFNGLHDAIRSNKEEHDMDIREIEDHLLKVEIKTDSNRDWIKAATGGLAVITVIGATFIAYFKTLNKEQIREVINETKQADQIETANKVVKILEDRYDPEIK